MPKNNSDNRGRPEIDKEAVVQKLAPYLQRGLSVKKACLEAQVPHASVYVHMKEDEDFSDQIRRLQNYFSVIYADIRFYQLTQIFDKVNKARNEKKAVQFTKQENKLLEWFGQQSKQLREEWGQKLEVGNDPDNPIIPMLINDANVLKTLLGTFEEAMKPLKDEE